MPNEKKDAEEMLQKLGQRIRRGAAKLHPVTEKELEAVRTAVRQQHQEEQKSKSDKDVEREQERDRGR